MNTIKRYDAYLTFPAIHLAEQETIVRILADQGLEVHVQDDALEFSFEGRDVSDNIVKSFVAIAAIVTDAEGELRCEIDDDEQRDPRFEFSTIANAQLWKQRARIVRDEVEKVLLSPNSP